MDRLVAAPASGLAIGGLAAGRLAVTDDGAGVAQEVVEQLRASGLDAVLATELPDDVAGVLYLGGLREVTSPGEAVEVQRAAFRLARAMAATIRELGGVFVTVQDTGGDFGLRGAASTRAWLGGLAALSRTLGREWTEASTKAIDCERGGRTPAEIAAAIVEELLTGGRTVDVGLRADGTRWALQLAEEAVQPGEASLGTRSVVVVTGGARGVTGAVVRELARRFRPHLLLLGTTPVDEEPPEAEGVFGEIALKRALADRTRSPAQLGAHVRQIMAAREIRRTLRVLQELGSPARYLAADVRDSAQVAAALDEARRAWGPITAVVHGAGRISDRLIADKTDSQFDDVFDTKVTGLRRLLEATADDPLELLCLFSSTAARFGTAGQSDYAMGNEVLNQVARASTRPGALVRAIAWGPWHGGMVDEALERHFHAHGHALIPIEAGARSCVDELSSPASDSAVHVTVDGAQPLTETVERTVRATVLVSERSHPQLADHAVDGQMVVPAALVLEWLMAAAGGCAGLRDIAVLRKIGALAPLLVTGRVDGMLEVRGAGGQVHYRARAVQERSDPRTWGAPAGLSPPSSGEIYDSPVLFHGPRFQSLTAVDGLGTAGATGTVIGAGALGWGQHVGHTDPAAVDGAIQLAGVWAGPLIGPNLPMGMGEFRLHGEGPLVRPASCVVVAGQVGADHVSCDVAVLDDAADPLFELLDLLLVRRP